MSGSQMRYLLRAEDDISMNADFIPSQRLYRPGVQMEHQLRVEAESHLREGYSVGTYTDPDKINEILKYHFSFYETILSEKLPLVASRHFMEFIFWQYDIAARIESLFKERRLPMAEARQWRELGAVARRSMKFLAEAVTRLAPAEGSFAPRRALYHVRDIVWICAEQVLRLSQVSDQTFFLFPERTILEILPEGRDLHMQLRIRDFDDGFFRRVVNSRDNEKNYLPQPDFEVDVDKHLEFLDAAFASTFGATYEDILRCLLSLIEKMPGTESTCDVPLGQKQWVIQQTASNLSVSEDAAGRLLSGFTVTKEAMDKEGRVPWKPNQQHRAFYRGFFELPHAAGPILMWSREMARECFFRLSVDLVYQRVAPEWASDDIEQCVAALSNAHGRWFEEVTSDNLHQMGLVGVHSRKSIGIGNRQISVPTDVGEIDYLGYSPRESLLVVAECKASSIGSESRFFRNELTQFVTRRNSYTSRFRRKIKWVRENWQTVSCALESEHDVQKLAPSVCPTAYAAVMITRRPTIASDFIDDFPCISLTELRMAHNDIGRWPYELRRTGL